MRVYLRVLGLIQGTPQNGHAIANQENTLSLAIAKKEIDKILEKRWKLEKEMS